MVDGAKRLAGGCGEDAAGLEAHGQTACDAGPARGGHKVNFAEGEACVGEGGGECCWETKPVCLGGEMGYDAAEALVDGVLAQDNVGKDVSCRVDNGDGSVVKARFKGKDGQGSCVPELDDPVSPHPIHPGHWGCGVGPPPCAGVCLAL